MSDPIERSQRIADAHPRFDGPDDGDAVPHRTLAMYRDFAIADRLERERQWYDRDNEGDRFDGGPL